MEDCWHDLKLDSANITIQGTLKRVRRWEKILQVGGASDCVPGHPVGGERNGFRSDYSVIPECGKWSGCLVRGSEAGRLEDWG